MQSKCCRTVRLMKSFCYMGTWSFAKSPKSYNSSCVCSIQTLCCVICRTLIIFSAGFCTTYFEHRHSLLQWRETIELTSEWWVNYHVELRMARLKSSRLSRKISIVYRTVYVNKQWRFQRPAMFQPHTEEAEIGANDGQDVRSGNMGAIPILWIAVSSIISTG